MKYNESSLEEAALEWFKELGYQIVFGPDIEPESEKPEREKFSEVVLVGRLKEAITKINPSVPEEAREEALKKVTNASLLSSHFVSNNKAFHRMLVDGVDVEYRRKDGSIAGDKVWLIDKANPENNDWVALNQFTVIEGGLPRPDGARNDNNGEFSTGSNNKGKNRRPDVVIFINGLPLATFELKNLADEKVSIKDAFNQFQTYKTDIPSLFTYNELLIISDGIEARAGTITADMDRFMIWRTVDGTLPKSKVDKKFSTSSNSKIQLEILIKGIFEKSRFLDIINNFIVYENAKEKDAEVTYKKIAAYHQYFATNKALESTLRATAEHGDRRAGVVWHTQGSGKSLTMLFYAGKLIQALNNPTLVILTDRNDLDDQLFGIFTRSRDILRQKPERARNRRHLRNLLRVNSGGVVFTTIQKFLQKGMFDKMHLSDRRNIVVIADEAHRSQYDFIDGFARHMHEALPNASFIGFTGTPIELADKNTRAVFGDYVDIYDIAQAVDDHATVPIFYEARLAKIELLESERPKIDPEFEELTEGEEAEYKEKLKSKWSRLEAMVGSEKRIKLIAQDIVNHFENRLSAIDGKGMIVAMSRRIAVELYEEIIKLRPDWHNIDDSKGLLKVVMTGSASDESKFQPHIRNKEARDKMADRMRDPKDELKLVIVRDMWLTGFDVPSLHTMYVDKPMKGHGLMQAIARVNRVYKDKQGGLVVDYLGIAPQLKEALAAYTDNNSEEPVVDQEEAVSVMMEKFEITKELLHGFDYDGYFSASQGGRTNLLMSAADFVLGLEEGKERYVRAVLEASKAFSLAVPHEKALEIRDELAFFQGVKGVIRKNSADNKAIQDDYDLAIKQIVSKAVTSDEVVDVFKMAGLDKPEVGILSDEFLEEVRGMKLKNLALEALKKLLADEIRAIGEKNFVKGKSFAEMLEKTIIKYQNKTIEAAEVIAELIKLAKNIRKETEKGKHLGLSSDELAFYDALVENPSAVKELGDETLKKISQELVQLMRDNTTIDWAYRDNVRAKIRIYVRKLLKKYDYPPDHQESATQLVLLQAETVCKEWSGEQMKMGI